MHCIVKLPVFLFRFACLRNITSCCYCSSVVSITKHFHSKSDFEFLFGIILIILSVFFELHFIECKNELLA